MPPLPPASTIGTSPDGRGSGRELGQGPAGRDAGQVLHVVPGEDLVALGAGQ